MRDWWYARARESNGFVALRLFIRIYYREVSLYGSSMYKLHDKCCQYLDFRTEWRYAKGRVA
jgi:hypothetical protein